MLVAAALAASAGFVALGLWQVERRVWKLELIARVERRAHADPVPAPGPDDWPRFSAAGDEYRRVRIAGVYLHERETVVQASTRLGSGYWVLTPMRTAGDYVVLVNRGFVPAERRARASRSAAEPRGEVTVTGLLRPSEPGGAFLRRNDPSAGRWYSRDVQAIAQARGLARAAPFFVDAEAPAGPGVEGTDTEPTGGLMALEFRNDHLAYALTWFALAAMAAAAAVVVLVSQRRQRREFAPGADR